MSDERRIRGAQRSSIAERKYAMTCDEIAEALGISAQRVSQLQASAIRKVRKGLAQRGYGLEDVTDLPGWLIAYWLDIR